MIENGTLDREKVIVTVKTLNSGGQTPAVRFYARGYEIGVGALD